MTKDQCDEQGQRTQHEDSAFGRSRRRRAARSGGENGGRNFAARHRQAETAARPRRRRRPRQTPHSGKRATLNVQKGDEVIYGKYAGNDVTVDRKEIKILRESDILAKVVK